MEHALAILQSILIYTVVQTVVAASFAIIVLMILGAGFQRVSKPFKFKK